MNISQISHIHRSAIEHRTAIVLGALALLIASEDSQAQPDNLDAIEIETLHVSDNIYMLVGAGGNVAVSVGDDGVFIVDDQYAPLTEKIVRAIRALSDGPIRFVINTHAHGDHVGGNENFTGIGALIVAHDNTRERMAEGGDAASGALPVITFGEQMSLHLNGEDVDIIHVGPAHTDGDVFVFFRGSNVLHMGDVLLTENFPVIDVDRNGSLEGLIRAQNLALDLVTAAPGFLSGHNNRPGSWPDPSNGESTDTIVIPGHGRLYDEADLVQYRDMVVIIRDRIVHYIEQGMSLDEVKAADPSLGWNNWYGSDTPPFTTARFIEAAYGELSRNR